MRLFAILTLFAPIAFSSPAGILAAAHPVFEPNTGQVGKSVEWVVRRGASTPMFLRATGAAIARDSGGAVHFMEMRFDGARADAESAGEEPLESYSNYYLGRDDHSWFTRIAHFARVRYRNVYPGIDVVYRSDGNDIEYDFDVKPGADPARIHISFHGIDSLRTSNGDLILTSAGRELRQRRPRVWQGGVEIDGAYRIATGHRVEIALARYDRSRALLIDPVVLFASYLGGPSAESIGGIQVDSQGNLYIAGSTSSMVAPTLNPFTQSGQTVTSPCIFKFTPDGEHLLFFLTLAVDNTTYIQGMAIDTAGNILVTGATAALRLPLKNPIDSVFKAKQSTAFATKWSAGGGAIVYSTYFGGSGNEIAAGAVTDSAGNLYFAGTTSSPDLPVVNALQPAFAGGVGGFYLFSNSQLWTSLGPQDCYVAKLSPQGSIAFSTYLGGSGDDVCSAIALSPDGSLVIVGNSDVATKAGRDFPLANAILNTPVPAANSFATLSPPSPIVVKMRGDGQALLFSTYAMPTPSGPAVEGFALAVAVDPAGNIYFGGGCAPGMTTKNAIQTQDVRGANDSACVGALDPAGQNILYTTYLDGASSGQISFITGMAADAQGGAYVAGYTFDSDFPLKNPIQGYQGGGNGNDFFLTRLAPAGSLVYSTYLGGNDFDYTALVTTGPDGSAYFAGTTFSTNIPTTPNAYQPNPGRSSDIVFMKISDTPVTAGPPAILTALSGTPQTGNPNTAFAAALAARVTDSAGVPVSGATVNFSAPSSGATATLSASSVPTDLSGIASVTPTANGITGSYAVTASTAGVSRTATFALTNAIANVTVQTSPAGLAYQVDGATYTASRTFTFPVGSTHLLLVLPAEANGAGARGVFSSWSDGLAIAHGITASASPVTYTAAFTQQYELTATVSPAGSGTVTPASGFFDAGSTVTLTAAPSGTLVLASWTGPVTSTGPLTGTVMMSGPVSVIANFGAQTAPSSVISALVHGASYQAGPIAPNEFLTAFGTFPGCDSAPAQVTVGGAPAQTFYSSATQVNLLMPSQVPAGSQSNVQISCPGSTPVPFSVSIASAAPGLFTISQDGKGQVDVVNQDGTVNTPTPAGAIIAIYGTGFGAYNPPSSDGLTRLALPVTAALAPQAGNASPIPLTVVFAGQAPGYSPGLQQINVQVPANAPPGALPLLLTVGSAPNQTQASATLNIAPAPGAATSQQRVR